MSEHFSLNLEEVYFCDECMERRKVFGWPRLILMLITGIKYESGEEIILGVIRKNNASKKVASEILFWSS